MSYSPYALFMLVSAPHLDYSDGKALVRSIARHGDFGHAWIRLCGDRGGEAISIEGGHSGELGISEPRYFDRVMQAYEAGEANPIKELWVPLSDGFFQRGDGGHRATFAAKVSLTAQQFDAIMALIENGKYPFSTYSLTAAQCCSFVQQAAALAGLPLDCNVTVPLPQTLTFRGQRIRLWSDPHYREFSFPSPDLLEKALIDAVANGRAENALYQLSVFTVKRESSTMKEEMEESCKNKKKNKNIKN